MLARIQNEEDLSLLPMPVLALLNACEQKE
jgi:hypothetical protein